jgi:hypothetical protein
MHSIIWTLMSYCESATHSLTQPVIDENASLELSLYPRRPCAPSLSSSLDCRVSRRHVRYRPDPGDCVAIERVGQNR